MPIQERFASLPHSRSVSTPNPSDIYDQLPPLRPSTPPARSVSPPAYRCATSPAHPPSLSPFNSIPPQPLLSASPPSLRAVSPPSLRPVSPQPYQAPPSLQPPAPSPTQSATPSIVPGPIRRLTVPVTSLFHIESADETESSFLVRYLNTVELNSLKTYGKMGDDLQAQRSFEEDGSKLYALDHPNVVKTLELLEDPVSYAILSEHPKGGSLLDKLLAQTSLCESLLPRLLSQLFAALEYTHSHGLPHLRLSLSDLVLSEDAPIEKWTVKVAGWDRAKTFARSPLSKASPSVFIAPEVFKGQGCPKSDTWSCGVIAYTLMYGQPPFSSHAYSRSFLDSKAIPIPFTGKPISDETVNLLRTMLDWNVETRPAVEECAKTVWERQGIPVDKVAAGLAASLMKKVLKEFIVENGKHKTEIAELARTFKAIDANGNYILTSNHLTLGLSKIMPVSLAKSESERIMRLCDSSEMGLFNYQEFLVSAYNEKRVLSHDNLYTAFQLLDLSDEGKVRRYDLIALFAELKENEKKKLWRNLCKAMDRAGLQDLSFKDFSQLVLRQTA